MAGDPPIDNNDRLSAQDVIDRVIALRDTIEEGTVIASPRDLLLLAGVLAQLGAVLPATAPAAIVVAYVQGVRYLTARAIDRITRSSSA